MLRRLDRQHTTPDFFNVEGSFVRNEFGKNKRRQQFATLNIKWPNKQQHFIEHALYNVKKFSFKGAYTAASLFLYSNYNK